MTFDLSWSSRSLEDRLRADLGRGGRRDTEPSLRFAKAVVDIGRQRYFLSNETIAAHPIVFFLHPKDPPESLAPRERSLRIPMFDEARVPISGKLWFVNEIANEAVSIGLDEGEDEAHILALAMEHGLDRVPTTTIDLQGTGIVARFYPDGLGTGASCQRVDLTQQHLELDDVREVIEGVYVNELCTPDAQGHVATTWTDPAKLVPAENVELLVQRILKIGLTARFFGAFEVRQEQPAPVGRYDLVIEQPDLFDRTRIKRHAVLELKVLRAKTSTGGDVRPSANRKAIKKGVKQAAIYRDQWHIAAAALCCFDMRADVVGQSMFEEVADKAERASVALWTWHLFASSEAYRDFLFEAAAE